MRKLRGTSVCVKSQKIGSEKKRVSLRQWLPMAFCIGLLLPTDAFAGSFGVGFAGGDTFISYNISSKLRAFIPLTMQDVSLDYRFMTRGLGSFGGFRLKAYAGCGTTVSLGDMMGKKAKGGGGGGDILGGFGASIRLSIGVETRMSRFPVTIFWEMNPNVDIDNPTDIKWKKFNLGFLYRF